MKKTNQNIEYNQFNQPVGSYVDDRVEFSFNTKTLYGSSVALYVLNQQEKRPALWQSKIWKTVSTEQDLSCWTYLPYLGFSSEKELAENIEQNFNFQGTTHYLIEVSGDIVGWIALMNQRTDHRVVEIGNVYFSHLMKRSKAATEVIYLLLKTCFEQGFRRVEWKCDDLNAPSKKAALRFGFCFEGVFRQDRISKGRNRNTAWFSILDEEWEYLKKAYEAWLSVDNFDEQNIQRLGLEEFKQQYI